jgi:hypothetical protein
MLQDTTQEQISDEMSRRRRMNAVNRLTDDLTTEDIEMINERCPNLAAWALHTILNPEVQQ